MSSISSPNGTRLPIRPAFCVGCALALDGPFIRCKECWAAKKPSRFCKWCAGEIDAAKRNAAKKFRREDGSPGEATQCRLCAKCGPALPPKL